MNLTIKTTGKRQVIDITDEIQAHLPRDVEAVAIITVLHTTAALTTADLDPGTDQDLLDYLELSVPADHTWHHPHDPGHAPDHLISSVIGPSVCLPARNGLLLLGTWQRVVLVEMDGPRERQINLAVVKTA